MKLGPHFCVPSNGGRADGIRFGDYILVPEILLAKIRRTSPLNWLADGLNWPLIALLFGQFWSYKLPKKRYGFWLASQKKFQKKIIP